MKRILTAVLLLTLSYFMCTCARIPDEEYPDYLAQMVDAAVSGDLAAGRQAEFKRNQHIDELFLNYEKLSFDDLFLLSKFIMVQSKNDGNNDDYRLCIGEVVLNRVASREFPNSISDVIYEQGAFERVDNEEFKCGTLPNRDCVELALRLLQGERLLSPHVVHWSSEPETEVYATFCDRRQNFTYFCESAYPRFYHLSNKKAA